MMEERQRREMKEDRKSQANLNAAHTPAVQVTNFDMKPSRLGLKLSKLKRFAKYGQFYLPHHENVEDTQKHQFLENNPLHSASTTVTIDATSPT